MENEHDNSKVATMTPAATMWLARASALLAVSAIVTGALATDHVAGLSVIHPALGIASLVLALPLLRHRMAQVLILPGLLLELLPVPPILHAWGAPLIIGPAIALSAPLQPMATQISAGLRNIIVAAPPLILLQIALGAAYRHKAIGVIWHIAGAMSVAGLVVIACVLLLRQIPAERAPRLAAGWLNGILVTQVTLGMSTLLLRMLDMDAAHTAAAHITGGSLTFACSLVLLRATQRSSAMGALGWLGGSQ
jgi:hypothetical protein